jgi:hypothetical protein
LSHLGRLQGRHGHHRERVDAPVDPGQLLGGVLDPSHDIELVVRNDEYLTDDDVPVLAQTHRRRLDPMQ